MTSYPELENYLSPFMDAWKGGAQDQMCIRDRNQIDKRDIFMTDTFVDHHLRKQRKHQLYETAEMCIRDRLRLPWSVY